MNKFEAALTGYIGENRFDKIKNTKIGIAGAGGLGSNCAVNLVRSGFSKLVIADFDIIEYKNLNRQFYFEHQVGMAKVKALQENRRNINPSVEVCAYQLKITQENIHEIFDACDVIVEAFDNAACKRMLVEEYLEQKKLLVAASGIAGFADSDNIRIHQVRPNVFVIGDNHSEVSEALPPMAARVTIAAAKQADIIIRYVLKEEVC